MPTKGNKSNNILKNLRTISLLNTSFTVAAAVVANGIKNILPLVVNEDQKGVVPGRYIGQATRLNYDLMAYSESYQIPGLLNTYRF